MSWIRVSLIVFCTILVGYQSVRAGNRDLYAAAGMNEVTEPLAAPAFALATIEGRSIDSNSLRGKVVLVNFWATWCGPCKEEMPSLQRLQQALPTTDFAVIAVTTDEQRKAIEAFAQSLELAFPLLLDETKDVSLAFGVRGLPTTVILDREGHLVGRAIGPRQWDSHQTLALLKYLLR
jgi:thiol-disulfide isomerase/thioredoxin